MPHVVPDTPRRVSFSCVVAGTEQSVKIMDNSDAQLLRGLPRNHAYSRARMKRTGTWSAIRRKEHWSCWR